MGNPLISIQNGLTSGIRTEAILDPESPGFRVEWVDWDSDFRGKLRPLDLITAIDGKAQKEYLRSGFTSLGIGQATEDAHWEKIGAKDGQELALSVLRDGKPITVKGKLQSRRIYLDQNNRMALAPGGPDRMAQDGLGAPWLAWYESAQKKLSFLMTRGWTQRQTSRYEYSQLLEWRPHIDALLKNYPGAFADAMRDDWQQVLEDMKGSKIELSGKDLEYREIGAKRVETAKQEAAKAWAAFQAEIANQTLPPFPAPSPYDGARVAGKIAVLPAITPRSILNAFGGLTFAAAGSGSDGYYFVLYDTKEMRAFYQVMRRYMGQVNPRMAEKFRFIGHIQDEAKLFNVGGKQAFGLTIALVAVMAGDDELFVDLRGENPGFAGEKTLASFSMEGIDHSSPEKVIQAMISAVKIGDEKSWRSLFADWRIAFENGKLTLETSLTTRDSVFQSEWESSRRLILSDVFDARVEKAEPTRFVLKPQSGERIPTVEEAVVWVDHYGSFEGEYRRFQSPKINRGWTLQRVDGGPWKIGLIQHL